MFAPFTGVSLDGHIMLNSGEVRNNWLEVTRSIYLMVWFSLIYLVAFKKH